MEDLLEAEDGTRLLGQDDGWILLALERRRKDGTLVPDVEIGDWARPWNSKSDRRIGDAPPSALWATEDGGFGQVGCVYTAQGFEYDWNGVIIGPDLVWRDGRFITVRSANKDPNFRSQTQSRIGASICSFGTSTRFYCRGGWSEPPSTRWIAKQV